MLTAKFFCSANFPALFFHGFRPPKKRFTPKNLSAFFSNFAFSNPKFLHTDFFAYGGNEKINFSENDFCDNNIISPDRGGRFRFRFAFPGSGGSGSAFDFWENLCPSLVLLKNQGKPQKHQGFVQPCEPLKSL